LARPLIAYSSPISLIDELIAAHSIFGHFSTEFQNAHPLLIKILSFNDLPQKNHRRLLTLQIMILKMQALAKLIFLSVLHLSDGVDTHGDIRSPGYPEWCRQCFQHLLAGRQLSDSWNELCLQGKYTGFGLHITRRGEP
jgi:hypothetical protein